MPTVRFVKQGIEVEAAVGEDLRSIARRAGVEVHVGLRRWFHCCGLGLCAGCPVLIRKGQQNVSPPGLWEKLNIWRHPMAVFARIGHEHEFRLACQTKVLGDVEVETQPEFNWHGERFWH